MKEPGWLGSMYIPRVIKAGSCEQGCACTPTHTNTHTYTHTHTHTCTNIYPHTHKHIWHMALIAQTLSLSRYSTIRPILYLRDVTCTTKSQGCLCICMQMKRTNTQVHYRYYSDKRHSRLDLHPCIIESVDCM